MEQIFDVATLHRQATELKNNGDLLGAIAALRQAKSQMVKRPAGSTVESWLRLPLFLQHEGMFDEAMVEFEELLASPPVTRDAAHIDPRTLEMLTHAELCAIYDKMRLACDRENLFAKSSEYEKLSVKHDKAWAKLSRKIFR